MLLKPINENKMSSRRSAMNSAEALERNCQLHESLRAELALELAQTSKPGAVGRRINIDTPGLSIKP